VPDTPHRPHWVRPTVAVEVEYRQAPPARAAARGAKGHQAGQAAEGDPANRRSAKVTPFTTRTAVGGSVDAEEAVPSACAARPQTFTALMYSTGMFEEQDGSLMVSVLTTLNPNLRRSSQSCLSVSMFFPNPFGGFAR
jgi:hypothetical protein